MTYVLFVLFLMLGMFVQGIAGFGGTLISMPLCIMLSGMEVTKPVVTVIAWISALSVTVVQHRYIKIKELIRMVIVMAVGVLFGMWVSGRLSLDFLLIAYAVVVFAIGVVKLFFPPKKSAPPAVQYTALGIAGLMQGLFVSGGSFIAVYAVERLRDKREFRATVNTVWSVINVYMIVKFALDKALTPKVLILSASSVIPILFATWLGGLLAKKVDQKTFLKIIYVVLIISGIVLFITNI